MYNVNRKTEVQIMLYKFNILKQPVLYIVLFIIFTVSVFSCSARDSMTKEYVQNILKNPPSAEYVENLVEETRYGCVTVPAKSFWQRWMVGLTFTEENCSVVVQPNNTVVVSFLGDKAIPVVSINKKNFYTDTFLTELGNNQVLIVQHQKGRVVSVTQTIYDENNNVVYGKSGKGDFIKECHIGVNNKSNSPQNCKF